MKSLVFNFYYIDKLSRVKFVASTHPHSKIKLTP